jgi:hypothetical protein
MGAWGLFMVLFPLLLGAFIVAGWLGIAFAAIIYVSLVSLVIWFGTRNSDY